VEGKACTKHTTSSFFRDNVIGRSAHQHQELKGANMTEAKDGCVKPSKGPIGIQQPQFTGDSLSPVKEVPKMLARVGKPAPDFELSAFLDGGFKNIKLSDYKGKWIVICFYPGDFTFV
jgi:hypothetical protein